MSCVTVGVGVCVSCVTVCFGVYIVCYGVCRVSQCVSVCVLYVTVCAPCVTVCVVGDSVCRVSVCVSCVTVCVGVCVVGNGVCVGWHSVCWCASCVFMHWTVCIIVYIPNSLYLIVLWALSNNNIYFVLSWYNTVLQKRITHFGIFYNRKLSRNSANT